MSFLERTLMIAVGGAIGSCARYELGALIARRYGTVFPWGTFVINVTGSLILGFFLALALERVELDPRWRFFVAVGICGGYTTFSTFAWETVQLIDGRNFLLAALNAGGSAVAGVIAVVAGAALARWIW
jgi:CrcB protein